MANRGYKSRILEHAPMWTRQKRQSNKARFILPCLSAGVIFYFAHHIYQGAYGLDARENLVRQINLLETELEHWRGQNAALRERAVLLKNGSLEKDMLDEYARRHLSVLRPNELVIMVPKEKNSN